VKALRALDSMFTPGWVLGMGLWLSSLMLLVLAVNPAAPWGSDLAGHLTGARLVLGGEADQLYDLGRQQTVQEQYAGWKVTTPAELDTFVSPPFVAWLYVPLALLPFKAARLVWELLTLGAVALSLRLLWPLLPGLHRLRFWRVLVAVLCMAPAIMLFLLAQDTGISLLLLVAGLILLQHDRDELAGAILGLGMFKPQLFFLMPLLFLSQRRYKALRGFIVTGGLLGVASLVLVRPAGVRAWLELLRGDAVQQTLDQRGAWLMLSFPALLRYIGLGAWAIPAGLGLLLLIAVLLAPALLRPADGRRFRLLYGAAILAAILCSPHVFAYDGVLVAIPALLAIDAAPEERTIRYALAVAWCLVWLWRPALAVIPLFVFLVALARLVRPAPLAVLEIAQ
jgi:hypothetical protein